MSKHKYIPLEQRAEDGLITEEEVSAVARELRDPTPESDIPMLLVILGAARELGLPYRFLVESYLQHPEYVVAEKALEVLVDQWYLGAEYRDHLLALIQCVSNDPSGFLQSAALTVSGKYLETHPDPEILRILLDMFSSEDSDENTHWHVYSELVRAMGGDWPSLLMHTKREVLTKLFDPSVIQRARERLASEEAARSS